MNQEELKQSAGILALTRVRNQVIDGLPEERRVPACGVGAAERRGQDRHG
ncbi:MAG: hypothetical protein HQ477_10700, partial [Chloroflexi bacterium]|nr:hypothetical protein [Chloroflexota bacterium]